MLSFVLGSAHNWERTKSSVCWVHCTSRRIIIKGYFQATLCTFVVTFSEKIKQRINLRPFRSLVDHSWIHNKTRLTTPWLSYQTRLLPILLPGTQKVLLIRRQTPEQPIGGKNGCALIHLIKMDDLILNSSTHWWKRKKICRSDISTSYYSRLRCKSPCTDHLK